MKKIKVIYIDFSGYSKGDKTVLYETADECINAGLNVTSYDLKTLEEKSVYGLVEIKNSDGIVQVYNNKASNPDKYIIIEKEKKFPNGGIIPWNSSCTDETIFTFVKPDTSKFYSTLSDSQKTIIDFDALGAAIKLAEAIEDIRKAESECNAAKEAEEQALYYEQAYADAELELSETETAIEYNERYIEQLKSRAGEIKYFLYGNEENR